MSAFEWVNATKPGELAWQLWVGGCLVATIKRRSGNARRGAPYPWWGYKGGDGPKQGPFEKQADAKKWAKDQTAAANAVSM